MRRTRCALALPRIRWSYRATDSSKDAPFKPGPTDGKTEKDGFTWVSMSMFDNKMEAFVKGPKGAIKQEGDWKSLEDFDKERSGLLEEQEVLSDVGLLPAGTDVVNDSRFEARTYSCERQ